MWGRINDYEKIKIEGAVYLLPYGQSSVELNQGIRLNESGELIWDGMAAGMPKNAIVDRMMHEYQLESDMRCKVEQDIQNFYHTLLVKGIITEEKGEIEYGWEELFWKAGPIQVSYKGPKELYDAYFSAFAGKQKKIDLAIEIYYFVPECIKNGTVLLRSDEVILMDCEEEYIFCFPAFPDIRELHLKKDGTKAELYCMRKWDREKMEDLFHAIRFAFLYTSYQHNVYLIHSASILYRGKAWLFAAKSGTGKTTHTELWKQYYDCELLNGDLNMIGIERGKVMVYGQPWCGTSGITSADDHMLGGIVFLEQGKYDHAECLSKEKGALAVLYRMISPSWTKEMLKVKADFADVLAAKAGLFSLRCTKEKSAVDTIKAMIDERDSF